MSLLKFPILMISALILCACSGTSPEEAKPKVQKSTFEQMKEAMDSSIANAPPGLIGGEGDMKGAKQLTASTPEEMLRMQGGDSQAAFFTDAHDPDAPIPGLEEAFASQNANQKWIQSYTQAVREAHHTGKPILIWFHHSKGSPPSAKLGAELFNTPDFEEWAKKNVIRVCYDQGEEFGNEQMGLIAKKKRAYVRKAPSIFGVRGTPVLLIMTPNGNKVDTIRGYYTGQNKLYFDQIKNDVKLATAQYEEFKKTLIPKGYRTWTGRNGNTLFAKLSRYDPENRIVWLQEADGHQAKTSIQNLSEADRTWVMDQQPVPKADNKQTKRPRS